MTSQPPKHRQSLKLRFRLRALILVAVTVCCVLTWPSSQTRLAMRQQHAVEQIRQLGGHASYAHQLEGKPPPMPPAHVRRVAGNIVMSSVVRVSRHAVHASDNDTRVLAELPQLNDLRLDSSRLNDAAMEPLSQLTELRRLDLWGSQVTDQSMPHLSNLHRLRRLSLHSPKVTDEGLNSSFLSSSTSLKSYI